MKKEEIKNLQEYAKKKFEEEKVDIKLCKVNMELSYEDNVKKIEQIISDVKQKEKWEEDIKKIVNSKSSETLERLYRTPKDFIKMVVSGGQNGLFLYGDGGWGKSYNVQKTLIENKLEEGEDYVFICGHITPLQFYMKLYEGRNKIIVFDDVNILENTTNLNMLKACLNENSHNKVDYHTTSKLMENKNIPSTFYFEGRVIILLNDKPSRNKNLTAVESRILHYHLDFPYKDKISIIFDIAKSDYEGINLKDRIKVANWIKNSTNEATENLSIRLLFKCFDFFIYRKGKDEWVELAKKYVKNDEYMTLIIQGVSQEDWCLNTGKSRASYFRVKAKVSGETK